jgi:hypothetical protein
MTYAQFLVAAKEVVANPIDQTRVDNAYTDLDNAHLALEIVANFTTFRNLILEVEKLDPDRYSVKSYEPIQPALVVAKAYVNQPNSVLLNISQEEANVEYNKLLTVRRALVERANISALTALIEMVSVITSDGYVLVTYELLQLRLSDALRVADEVSNYGETDQGEVDAVYSALSKAYADLLLTGDTIVGELEELIAVAKALDATAYTSGSFANIASPLAAAEQLVADVLAGEQVRQQEVDSVYNYLKDAIDGLQSAIDKAALYDLIEQIEALRPADYTPETWAAVETQLANAQHVYTDANINDPLLIEAAFNNLNAAKDNLELSDNIMPRPDLDSLLEQMESLDPSKFTFVSWSEVQLAANNARDVFNSYNATDEQLLNAYLDLAQALDNLVPRNLGNDKDQSNALLYIIGGILLLFLVGIALMPIVKNRKHRADEKRFG